jgi:hypothetical protein
MQPRVDRVFSDSALKPSLLALQPIIKGLIRFLPFDWITAHEALELIPEFEDSEESEDDEDSQEL